MPSMINRTHSSTGIAPSSFSKLVPKGCPAALKPR
jgi:hypothetical protein